MVQFYGDEPCRLVWGRPDHGVRRITPDCDVPDDQGAEVQFVALRPVGKTQFAAGVGGFLVWSWNNSPSNPVSWEVGPGDATLQVIDSY